MNFLIAIMVILSITLIGSILLQPDRSQTVAKTESVLDQEKEGIEKFTEYVAILFLLVAIIFYVVK